MWVLYIQVFPYIDTLKTTSKCSQKWITQWPDQVFPTYEHQPSQTKRSKLTIVQNLHFHNFKLSVHIHVGSTWHLKMTIITGLPHLGLFRQLYKVTLILFHCVYQVWYWLHLLHYFCLMEKITFLFMKEELFQYNHQIKYEPQNVTSDYTSQQLPSERPVYNHQLFSRHFLTTSFPTRELILYKYFSVVVFHTSPTIPAFVCLFIKLLSWTSICYFKSGLVEK